jgi:hypothetical protein
MRLGNESGLVFHNTVHSYCGLGLPHFFAQSGSCLIFHHTAGAKCLCGFTPHCHGFSTALSTVIVGWPHACSFAGEKLSDNDRQSLFSYLKSHGELHLAVHHPSRWLAHLAPDCMLHHRRGFDH